MSAQKFIFQKLGGILAKEVPEPATAYNATVVTFLHEMLYLGYALDQSVYEYLKSLGENAKEVCTEILQIAKNSVGYQIRENVLYPNFPQQVMEADPAELFLVAMMHYWSLGNWQPEYVKQDRPVFKEENEKKTIKLLTIEEVQAHFFKALESKSVLGDDYYEFIDFGLTSGWYDQFKGEIVFREILCKVTVHQLKANKPITGLIKSATDVLRIMNVMSGGRADLSGKISFKSLKRKHRRALVKSLNEVIKLDDVKKYRHIWVLAFHGLHIGEFKGSRAAEIANKVRNEQALPTESTLVCEAIKKSDVVTATDQLRKTPPIFARSIDKLLRDADEEQAAYVMANFVKVIDQVNSKMLLQLLGHFKGRTLNEADKRAVFTKGSTGEALLAPALKHLDQSRKNQVVEAVESTLKKQFRERSNFANKTVYLDPSLKTVVLPSQMGSAQSGKKTLYRGSRISMVNTPEDKLKSTIRLFVHWVGQDIDLSALFVSEDLTKIDQVSYTQLKTEFCFHSGDLTSAPAPLGASEYVDIDIDLAIKAGYRYACMDVRVYSGPSFSAHQECYAGFMFRENPKSGEIFEPASVYNKFDLVRDATSTIPCLFDLVERNIIWIDSSIPNMRYAPNNIVNNSAKSTDIMKAFLDMVEKKVTVYELMKLHADSVDAKIVEDKEEADLIVGNGEGDVDVQDVAEIMANWL